MSILFNTDDLVNISDHDDFSFGDGASTDSPFSISAWIKMADATTFRILAKTAPATNLEYLFSTTGSDLLRLQLFDLNLSNSIGADTVALTADEGSWIHVVGTYDGSSSQNGLTLYRNGVDATNARALAGTYNAMHNLAIDVKIGANPINADFANGQINEVTIWSVELTALEVARIYNARRKYMPSQVQVANRIGDWPMDDGQDGISADGDTIRDLSGNGHNGVGNDGANNTGLAWKAEEALSYPVTVISVLEGNLFPTVDAGADKYVIYYGTTAPLSDATFSDPDGTVDHAYIDINGGGFTEIAQGSYSTLLAAVQAYIAKFPDSGAITVTLKVEDNNGATSQDSMIMNVLTVDADDVLEIDGIKYDVVDGVNWDIENHHLKIPVIKRV
ncbi:MAG: LamG domain-containing protein [Candidatus Peribacteraceae bacterium]|nr:LamG domain-containing protein [Candidatus Peribacteraceae bacterium]